MPRANGITRQEILTAIKVFGAMTAEELSHRLEISPVAVRQHLTSLEAEGTVVVAVERRGLGRPSHRYRITETGDEGFPRAYDLLATQLLDELKIERGEEAVKNLNLARHERLRASVAGRLQGATLQERMQKLVQLETERGYMAEVKEVEAGEFLFIKRNCAVCSTARHYPEVCCGGLEPLYTSVLGEVKVQLEQMQGKGSSVCVFRVCEVALPQLQPGNAVEETRNGLARNKKQTLAVLSEEAITH